MPATEVQEVEEDFVMDEDDYTDDAEAVEESSGSKTTQTSNFMGDEPEIVDEIVDLGVPEPVPNQDSFVVRVVDDIPPVYYGKTLMEFKRGRQYRVPPHIHRWLVERKLIWEH